MKVRIISAAVLIPVLLILLMVAPTIVTAVVWGLLLAISVYELLYTTGLVRESRLVVIAAVMAFGVALWSHFGAIHAYGLIGIMIFTGVLFGEMMLSHVKITFDKVCLCMMARMLGKALRSILSLANKRILRSNLKVVSTMESPSHSRRHTINT